MMENKKKQKSSRFVIAIVIIFVAISAVSVPMAFNFMREWGETEKIPQLVPSDSTATPQPEGTVDILPTPTEDLLDDGSAFLETPQPWNGTDRITVLVMGVDYRDWQAGETASRTDTMMLLTIDPVSKSAGILSIPRDLWVTIPGFNPGKINTAHYLGQLYNLPGGGPGLAMDTVEQVIGVPIDYYARIDFLAFEKFIDIIGGVKVDIPERIRLDLIDPNKPPFFLEPGVYVLPGDHALAYARNRSTGDGDFGRAQRQQQVVMAIRNRIFNFDQLPELLPKIPEIVNELSSGIETNFPLTDIELISSLAVLALDIDLDNITMRVIGEDQIIYGTSPDDLAILIPVPDKIRELRDEIFASSSPYSPQTEGTDLEKMVQEFTTISIQNASSDGTASATVGTYLAEQGANIVEIGNYSSTLNQTVLIDHCGSPYAMVYLRTVFGVSPSNILFDFSPQSGACVEVRIGNDWIGSLP